MIAVENSLLRIDQIPSMNRLMTLCSNYIPIGVTLGFHQVNLFIACGDSKPWSSIAPFYKAH